MVLSIFEDSRERIWLGTINGLSVLSGTRLKYQLTNFNLSQYQLKNTLIRDFYEDKEGRIWVASHAGLFRFEGERVDNFKETLFDRRNGLSDNTIYSILPDQYNRLWLSSNKGLSVFDSTTLEVINFDQIEQLGQLEFNGRSRARDGNNLIFGGVNGLTQLTPVTSQLRDISKPTWITSVKYGRDFNSIYAFPDKLLLFKPEHNAFQISFSSSYLYNPWDTQYRYRLNQSKEWTNLQGHNELVFVGLKPGRYELEVQSKSLGADWKFAKRPLLFKIEEIFWLSTTAKLLYITLVVTFIFTIFLQEYRRRKLQYKALSKVKESEGRMKAALQASGQGLWDWSTGTNAVVRINIEKLFNIDQDDSYDDLHSLDKLIYEADLNKIELQRKSLFLGENVAEVQYRVKDPDGQWRWINDKGSVVERDREGNASRITGTYTDITALKRAEMDLKIFDEIIHSMTEAVVVMNTDREAIFVNPAFARITGYDANEVLGKDFQGMRSSKHSYQFYDSIWDEFVANTKWYGEIWLRCKNRKDILCALEAFQIYDVLEEVHQSVLIFNNITERRKAEEELSYLARYDTLTGLPNRSLFMDRLEHALALAKRHNHNIAVMFMDLDGFKNVNDSFGHQVGDFLLQHAAQAISEILREEDTLARLSGDEFILLIEEYDEPEQLSIICKKILNVFNQPIHLSNQEIVVTASIGVSQYPKDADDDTTLMKYADTAMYYAKENGKNQFAYYETKMHEQVIQRLYMEGHLRRALENDEFYIVLQPIIDVTRNHVAAMEALLRWDNPELGQVFPSDFIPLAEETGLIIDIGRVALFKVCQMIKKLNAAIEHEIVIAVNVSVRQLMDEDFIEHVESAIRSEGIPARQLKIEITESMLMANATKTENIVRRLKKMGVIVSVDDFGTGYSSLSYLKRFSVDELKIDKEFIADISEASRDEKIVNAILALAESLDMQVVAEGVETRQQYDYLKKRNCQFIQGYFISKPLAEIHVESFIKEYGGSIT
nr:EAL domain-containing protein [Pleionea sp. CnH1-48]